MTTTMTTTTTTKSYHYIGHVIIWLGIRGFLLVVHCNHASILHRYGDMGLPRYWGHDLDLLGSRDVIGPFLGPIFEFGGFFQGLDINFEFRFPKRFQPCVRPRCLSHRAWKSARRS